MIVVKEATAGKGIQTVKHIVKNHLDQEVVVIEANIPGGSGAVFCTVPIQLLVEIYHLYSRLTKERSEKVDQLDFVILMETFVAAIALSDAISQTQSQPQTSQKKATWH